MWVYPSQNQYIIARGKPAGHREVAPRECAVHPRWKPEREEKEEKKTEP